MEDDRLVFGGLGQVVGPHEPGPAIRGGDLSGEAFDFGWDDPKTATDRQQDLIDWLPDHHSGEVPELIFVPYRRRLAGVPPMDH